MVSVSLFLGKGNTIHWNDYQIQALTTAIFPLDRSLEYTVLGLVSEVGEMADVYYSGKVGFGFDVDQIKAAISEGADAFWYSAAVADALSWRLEDVATGYPGETIRHSGSRGLVLVDLMRQAGEMAGIVKKAIRDNDGYLTPEAMTRLHRHLWRTLWLLDNWCQLFGTTRYVAMSNNLNKLADRKTRGVLAGSGNNR